MIKFSVYTEQVKTGVIHGEPSRDNIIEYIKWMQSVRKKFSPDSPEFHYLTDRIRKANTFDDSIPEDFWNPKDAEMLNKVHTSPDYDPLSALPQFTPKFNTRPHSPPAAETLKPHSAPEPKVELPKPVDTPILKKPEPIIPIKPKDEFTIPNFRDHSKLPEFGERRVWKFPTEDEILKIDRDIHSQFGKSFKPEDSHKPFADSDSIHNELRNKLKFTQNSSIDRKYK